MGVRSILLDISRTYGQHLFYIYEINVCQAKKQKQGTEYMMILYIFKFTLRPVYNEDIHPLITLGAFNHIL